MEEVVVSINNVSKDFHYSRAHNGTIKSLFTSFYTSKEEKSDKIQHALKNVSLDIKKGEFFGIVGRNGSGKSTLLKMIAGIYQPNSGSVHVRGKLVPFIELGVGFNPELTGRENVYLNGALLGFSRKEIEAQYDEIVEFAELEKFMEQQLKNYSSGMQVRLAFAMAVRAKADILLIDEVLAVGDADFQRKCFDYFKKLKKDKKTVIFVSHDMEAVKEFCDRAMLIEKSEVKAIDDTKKIADLYANLFLQDAGHEKQLNNASLDDHTGSGVVTIKDVALNKAVFTNRDSSILLSVTLQGNKPSHDLMTGFSIKNSLGLFVGSYHSWEIRKSLTNLQPGQTCTAVWDIPNIYEDGLYSIDVYALGKGSEQLDRIDEAIQFRVKRSNKSGALVVIKAELSLRGDDAQSKK